MTAMPMSTAPAQAVGRPATVVLHGDEGVPVPCRVVDVGDGNAAPVVFLHGLVGLNDHWEELVRLIQHRSRCVLFQVPLLDLTGEDCSIRGVTELTAKFLREHVRDPAVLVGNSFGGHVAAKIAIDHPTLASGLVLAGASGVIEKTIVEDVQIRPSREWLSRKIGELFFDQRNMNPADVDRAFVELSQRGHARAMVRLSRTARRNHLGKDLANIRVPTLLVWGRQDIVTPPEACETFAAKIPDARVVWLENCGHVPMIEGMVEQVASVTAFLDELDRRRGRAGVA